jgi:hypothetical protein
MRPEPNAKKRLCARSEVGPRGRGMSLHLVSLVVAIGTLSVVAALVRLIAAL